MYNTVHNDGENTYINTATAGYRECSNFILHVEILFEVGFCNLLNELLKYSLLYSRI